MTSPSIPATQAQTDQAQTSQVQTVCPECGGQLFVTGEGRDGERLIACYECGNIVGSASPP